MVWLGGNPAISSTGRKPWWKPIISSRWLGFCQPVRKTHGETELASLLFKVETWGSIRHYQTINLPIGLFTSLLCTKVGEVESLGRLEDMLRCQGVTDARWFPTLWAKSFNFLRLNWCVMESWWGFPTDWEWVQMVRPHGMKTLQRSLRRSIWLVFFHLHSGMIIAQNDTLKAVASQTRPTVNQHSLEKPIHAQQPKRFN